YYPFNLHNLDIAGPPAPAPIPAPAPTPTPPQSPPAEPPSSPLSLTAVAAGPHQINLSWSSSPGASQYVVERNGAGSAWIPIAMGVTTTAFSDSGLDPATVYSYRVRAVSGAGESPPSIVATAKTAPQPDVLSAQPLVFAAARRIPFLGAVATFTD